MLVVISDLHFEEVRYDRIVSASKREASFDERNLSPRAFRMVFRELATLARDNRAKRIDLVLAGDVFDLHRTTMWFKDDVRPYVSCRDVAAGSPLEIKVLDILDTIASEAPVEASLEVLRRFEQGGYYAEDDSAELSSFGVPTTVTYLPGNHDRLANATDAIRARVRKLLGIAGGGAPFPHVVALDDPRVLVRHGHEYDRSNFALPLPADADVATPLPDSAYDDWTFGDFITIEVAMGLPHEFREKYQDGIADDDVLKRIYLRLLQFDDVRPQSQLVPFLLSVPGIDPALVWSRLQPVVLRLLDRMQHDTALPRALAKGGVSLAWKALLDTRFWRLGLPMGLVRRLGALAGRADGDDPKTAASRESVLRSASKRFVIAGHTHRPQVALLAANRGLEQFFVDTGTWRNAVLSTGDDGFANSKALTYVVVYASDEDADGRTRKDESFDYWSGYTKRW